jgi:DNA-binding SARP family transcriptional activator
VLAAVWPGSPPRRPAQEVATLVSRIRATLGADAVLGGRACYRLGDGTGVDLHEATRRLVDAEAALAPEPATALAAAREAVAVLAAAPLLADQPDAGWVLAARADQAEAVRRARRVLAAAALRVGEAAVARDAAAAACADDPFDEEACRALMRAYDALGEPARALTAYDRLRAALVDELGVDPAAATQGLQVAILRSGTPEIAVPEGLVGRDGDLARLLDAWRAAGAGRGGLVLISGDPGIGKTRLADEMARAAAGRVLAVRCYEAERSLFLQPVVEALAAHVGRLPADRIRAAAADRPARSRPWFPRSPCCSTAPRTSTAPPRRTAAGRTTRW